MSAIYQPQHDGEKLRRPHASWVIQSQQGSEREAQIVVFTTVNTCTQTRIQALHFSVTMFPQASQ